MRVIATFLLIALLMACAPQSGNYAGLSKAYNTQIATDTAHRLVALYPPASTHLLISPNNSDAFGTALEKKLRESGYAIKEADAMDDLMSAVTPSSSAAETSAGHTYHSSMTSQKPAPNATHAGVPVSPVTVGVQPTIETKEIPLTYIVDQIGKGFYRVTVTVGSKSLSRVYMISGKRLVAGGAWALKE